MKRSPKFQFYTSIRHSQYSHSPLHCLPITDNSAHARENKNFHGRFSCFAETHFHFTLLCISFILLFISCKNGTHETGFLFFTNKEREEVSAPSTQSHNGETSESICLAKTYKNKSTHALSDTLNKHSTFFIRNFSHKI